ncbi:MAG: HlyD family efflux transporter periplasmic adaptor subunit [Cytophagaceae bacterium]|nr:HlyD family efflux transporter periplasmic adaptor subunit [Cytophagaceae bacterium]
MFENSIPTEQYEKLQAIKLVRTPHLAHKLAWWCGSLFMLLILILFLPWTQNISSRGKLNSLNPGDRPQTIQSTIAGRIEKWHVREGQQIKKGDTIVRLSEIKDKYFDPNLLSRMDDQIHSKSDALQASRKKAQSLNKQINALTSGLEYSLSKARNKVVQAGLKVQSDSMDMVAIKIENKISKDQFDRQQKLYDQGLKSLTELEQRKLKLQETTAKAVSTENKFNASKNELSNARIELFSLKAEYLDKIAKAESELNSTMSYIYNSEADISKMRNEYSNVKIRNTFYYITAPQDGYVIKAQKEGIGETIKEGEPVVTIMALNPNLAVELYIKPMDVPLLKIGSKIRLQFDGWPALVFSGWPDVGFGTFGGKVAVIDNIDTDGNYRILVVPDKEEDPWPKALRVGTGTLGWAMLKDVPIYYEIWRQMNGFPPDYTGNIQNKNNKKTNEKESSYSEQ